MPPRRLAPVEGAQTYLAALRSFSRNVRLFLVVTAFRGMVIASLQTVLNLYLYSLGFDARFIGIINAVNSLAVLVVSLPFGYLADRFGRKPLLLGGGIIYPLCILGLGLVESTPAILVFNFLFGAFAAAYWVAGVPLLFASTGPHERVHAFSLNSFLLWGFGPVGALASGQSVEIAARVLGVQASSASALRVGMLFMAALAAAGAIPYLFMSEPRRVEQARQEVPGSGRLARLFAMLLIPDLLLSFGLGAVLTFGQLYFHRRFGLDPGPIGAIVAVGGAIAGLGTLLAPVMARRWGNLQTAVRLQWSVVPLIVTVALAMILPIAVPAFWLLMALRSMSDPVYTAFIQERVPDVYRARLTGFYSVTYSIGYSFGPALSGQLQAVGGYTPAFLMGGGVYLLGGTLLYLFFARGRGADPEKVDRMVDTSVDGSSSG